MGAWPISDSNVISAERMFTKYKHTEHEFSKNFHQKFIEHKKTTFYFIGRPICKFFQRP